MTSVPKPVYVDKLDNLVNKFSNTYHSTVKMKPLMLNQIHTVIFDLESFYKHAKFKGGEYRTIRIILQTFTLQIGQKKFLLLKKLKIVHGGYM